MKKKILKKTEDFRHLVSLILVMLIGATAFGQPSDRQETLEKMQAAKVGVITQRLDLTSEQAQKFWPVYNEYESKQKAQRKQIKELKDREMKSDADYKKTIDDMLELRQKEVDLEKEYKNKFLKVITPRQLIELYKAEREFKMMILHKIEGRRSPRPEGRGGRGPRGPNPGRHAPPPGVNGPMHSAPVPSGDIPAPDQP